MPPSKPQQVYSSHIDTVHYNDETKELTVSWTSGKTSVYSSVPPAVANKVMNSWSVGTALREMIKPNYEHRYVEYFSGSGRRA